jgi:dephospho-CoA kinase
MKVAITGGIAEGKSTVLALLAELGYRTDSSDAVAREVFQLPEVQARLAEIAGLPLPVDRPSLRQALADRPHLRRAVNALMHPLIRARLRASDAQFVEVPLLLEACLQTEYAKVWVAACGREEQHRRLLERYGDPAHAEAIVASQLPTRVKIAFSDLTIRTNESLESVRLVVSESAASLFGV